MPLFVAAKSAILLGAAVGFVGAVVTNDKVIELAAEVLQKGADQLNKHLEKKRVRMASTGRTGNHALDGNLSDDDVTTPGPSDDEAELSDWSLLESGSCGKRVDDEVLSIHSLD